MTRFNGITNYKLISLFAGVGGIDLAFEKAGFQTIYANEMDENAAKTFKLNFPKVNLEINDVHKIDKANLPQTNVLVSGFPCQAFSIAGYQKGFDDERGDLFFETMQVAKWTKPEIIFLENVKNLISHDNGNTFKVILETLEQNNYFVKWKVLNAKDYGNVPQNRERIYIVAFKNKQYFDNFEFPQPQDLTTTLQDKIDFNEKVDEIYQYSKDKNKFYDELEKAITSQDTVYQWRRQYVRENKNGVSPTLTANMGTGGHNVPLIKSKFGIRKLTERECFNLQGFPIDFKLPNIAKSHLYKQAGNSVVIPVIESIAKNIKKAIESA